MSRSKPGDFHIKLQFHLDPLCLLSGCIYLVPLTQEADGGAPDASVVSQTDSGPVTPPDAGPTSASDGGTAISTVPVIPTLAPLDPAKCGTAQKLIEPLRPTCNSGEVCLGWATKGNPTVKYSVPGMLYSRLERISTSASVTSQPGALLSARDATGQRALFLAESSQPLATLVTTGEVAGAVWAPTGLWFISHNNGPTADLRKWTASSGAVSLGSFSFPPAFVTASVEGDSYFFADYEGLTELSIQGGALQATRRISMPPSSQLLHFAIEGDNIYFTECPSTAPTRPWKSCTLQRYQRSTQTRTTVIDQSVGLLNTARVLIFEDSVFVLDPLRVLRVPRSRGVVQTLYAGGEFPQYRGTLRSSSMEIINGKMYLGQVCEFDYDAPPYAAVEIDLYLHTARYLENDPDFPFVPRLEGPPTLLSLDAQHHQGGLFILSSEP